MTTDGATLAIVTCGPQLEVALLGPLQQVPSQVRLAGGSARSKLLLAAVELLVEDSGIDRSTIGRVVVTRGPGSFTGIRAGLASAAGLEAAIGAEVIAFDSLIAQAARVDVPGVVWAAQPGRRGEVYARPFLVASGRPPKGTADIEILSVVRAVEKGPWVAADALDLAGAERAPTTASAAEGLLRLLELGAAPQTAEPLYVEGPPIHRKARDG